MLHLKFYIEITGKRSMYGAPVSCFTFFSVVFLHFGEVCENNFNPNILNLMNGET